MNERQSSRGRARVIRDAVGSVLGVVLGIAPHVMHHIGLLAGAALVTGASGNLLFYVVGLLFSVPMLMRLHRRFRTWWAPTIALVVFTALFSLSAFVVGPAISGGGGDGRPRQEEPVSPAPITTSDHTEHHPDAE